MSEKQPPAGPATPGAALPPNGPGVARWPATIALLFLGAIFFLIAKQYPLGPRWSIPAVIALLLVPLWLSRLRGLHQITRILAFVLFGAMTAAVIASAILLIALLPDGKLNPSRGRSGGRRDAACRCRWRP